MKHRLMPFSLGMITESPSRVTEEGRDTYPVTELHHFRDDFLINAGENGVSNELHVFAGELVYKNLETQGESDLMKSDKRHILWAQIRFNKVQSL